jgi:hypothetical protein
MRQKPNMPSITLHRVSPEDADFMLDMSEIAGCGVPTHFFRQALADDEDRRACIPGRVRDPKTKMHLGKCWIAETGQERLGIVNLGAETGAGAVSDGHRWKRHLRDAVPKESPACSRIPACGPAVPIGPLASKKTGPQAIITRGWQTTDTDRNIMTRP